MESTLDIGKMFVSKLIMVLLGLICLPLLMALWELLAVIFFVLAGPAWIAREAFPSIAGFINGFFDRMWIFAVCISYKYFKFLLC